MGDFWLVFIPIFVAVDPVGLLPIFIGLTQELSPQQKRKIILESILTGLGLAVGFIFLGRAVFNVLGIAIGDFMIAGGVILFCIALMDLLTIGKERLIAPEELGAVPLGTPLLVGPAVLATSFIMIEQYGLPVTLLSILINILLVGVLFLSADRVIRLIGEGGARVLSKVMALLLAAIAVMMIRKGLHQFGLGV